MSGDNGKEALAAALIFSVVIHVALMFWAKPRVMTQISLGYDRTERRGPMKVSKAREFSDPVQMDMLEDVKAKKEAPRESLDREKSAADHRIAAPTVIERELPSARPVAEHKVPEAAENLPPEIFEAAAVKPDENLSPAVPVIMLEPPSSIRGASSPSPGMVMPEGAVSVLPSAPATAEIPGPSVEVEVPGGEMRKEIADSSFVPVKEVFEKVDEQVVAREKQAVRDLIESGDAEELEKFVNVAMAVSKESDWTYFKVMMVPRSNLQIVPKDVVVVIDASGSIGKDRLDSVRAAAKRLLRDATNSSDRFNLVAFRDRFTYAFKSWQECTEASFNASDRWLARLTPHGRTDVFASISSVLTLPRDPTRPVIALVITDGVANKGLSRNEEILRQFTKLNDGLISVYMYGVKGSANRELINVLTRGNRGESYIFDGMLRWRAGSAIDDFSSRFRDPLLTDLRIVFASGVKAQAYPRLLKNIYRGGTLEFYGRVPSTAKEVAFSLKGLSGNKAFESFFAFPVDSSASDPSIVEAWHSEQAIDRKLQ